MTHPAVIAEVRNPGGRLVRLLAATWDHVLDAHPGTRHLDQLMQTIARPDHREEDPRPGRERYFRRGGPERWIRVVSEFAGPHDVVITAFPQSNDPARPQP